MLRSEDDTNIVVSKGFYDRFVNETKIAHIAYNELIKNNAALDSRRARWERKFNITINRKEFLKLFSSLYTTTISTKFRDFQYRLLTGTLITNNKLWLWKIRDDNMCSFCEHEIEDEIHLLCNCKYVQPVWNKLKNYICSCNNSITMLRWTAKNIIFSSVHPIAHNVINFLITIVKQYIYRSRCVTQKPNADTILQEIENTHDIEFKIAAYKNKLNRHIVKWSMLKNFDDTSTVQEDYVQNYIHQM